MIKAITFDLDGVYFLNGKKNFIKALVDLGVSEEEAVRVFLKSVEMNELYKCGKWDDEEYWSWALKEWGLDLPVNEITRLLISGYEVNDDVVETVRKVRKAGYRTCICSNNFPARINGLNERFDFLKDFDIVVLSYEQGVTKPDKRIFKTLIQKSQVSPNELVYSDDDESKFAPAIELGINAFLYTDFESFKLKLQTLGVNLKNCKE